MSTPYSNNKICREKYINYGSYLNSRGYDREICNLITKLQNGELNIGSIDPGNCDSTPQKDTTIKGDVYINPCGTTDGQLYINGGDVSVPGNYGLQVENGANINNDVVIGGNLTVVGTLDISDISLNDVNVTTLTASGDISGNTIIANSNFQGPLTGDVTGDLTGDVTGNVTGDLTGNVIGDLTGNVTGDVTGDLTGNVTGDLTGNVTGDLTGNVIGDLTGNVTGDVTGDLTGNVTGEVTGNVTGDLTGNVTGDVTGEVTGDLTGNVTGDLTGNVTGEVTGDLTGDVTGNITSSKNPIVIQGITYFNRELSCYGETVTILKKKFNPETSINPSYSLVLDAQYIESNVLDFGNIFQGDPTNSFLLDLSTSDNKNTFTKDSYIEIYAYGYFRTTSKCVC